MRPIQWLALGAAALVLGWSGIATNAQTTKDGGAVRPSEPPVRKLIVKFKDETPQKFSAATGKARAMAVSKAGGRAMTYHRPMSGQAHVYRLETPLSQADARALAKKIELTDPSVEYAEPDVTQRAFATPNDPLFNSNQWHLKALDGGINAPAAWDISRGQGVVVAVIDTGVTSHPDLATNVVGGYDFITDPLSHNDGNGRDPDPSDPGDWCPDEPSLPSSWHGTHVAGTVAAVANNGIGVVGAAYEARVLPIRVLGRCGGDLTDIADAIQWAAGLPVPGVPNNTSVARVINLSLGSTVAGNCGPTYQAAVSAATTAGSLVVAATGNDSEAAVRSPANCTGAFAVTSHTLQGDRSEFANAGPGTAISAPGGGPCWTAESAAFKCATKTTDTPGRRVWSTYNAGTTAPGTPSYGGKAGTSMAAPHASAVAALLLSKEPTLTVNELRSFLRGGAKQFPANTYCAIQTDGRCGVGMLDAKGAIDALITSRAPIIAITAPAVTQGGKLVELSATAKRYGGGDLDASQFSWTQIGGPPVQLLNPKSNAVSFIATNPGGTHTFQVTATDGEYPATQTVVARSNNAPALLPAPAQVTQVGTPLVFHVPASDPEQDQLTFLTTSDLPPGSKLDGNGRFVWPAPAAAGSWSITVVASDGTLNSAPATFTVTATPPAPPPSTSSAVAPSKGGGGAIDLWAILLGLALVARGRR